MLLEDKQTKPKPKVKAGTMNPYTKKPAVKVPAQPSGNGKIKSVGNRGSKVERC